MTDYQAADQSSVMGFQALLGSAGLVNFAASIPGGEIMTGGKLVIDMMNVRPPAPFERAENAWKELGEQLDSYREDIDKLASKVHGDSEELWSGPGAEAMHEFVEKNLLPALKTMSEVCEQAEQACKQMAESSGNSAESWFIGIGGSTAVLLAATALLWAPGAGPKVCAATKAILATYGWVQDYDRVQAAGNDLQAAGSQTDDLSYAALDLSKAVGDKDDELQESLTDKLKDIETKLGDPEGWEKETT